MSSNDLRPQLAAAVRAAKLVAPLLRRWAGRPLSVRTKCSPIDLVTEVDQRAERLVRQSLTKAFPEYGFYGEETGHTTTASPYQWYVDPIDGTTNFIHGLPMFCTSIALARHGVPVVAAIYDPTRPELFTAIRGRGAFVNGRRLRVSRVRRLQDSLWSTGFPSEFRRTPHKFLRPFAAFQLTTHAVRRTGSAALNLAYVACGRLDGVWEERIWPWDMAAAMLLIREAGGRVTSMTGRATQLVDDHVFATNGRLHAAALRVWNRARRYPTPC